MAEHIRVCLVTFSGMSEENDQNKILCGDERIEHALRSLGAQCDIKPWDSRDCEWDKFDIVLCRSPWDYTTKPEQFSKWVLQMKAIGVNIFNKPDQIVWNMDKRYLCDLKQEGVHTPDFEIVEKKSSKESVPMMSSIMSRRGWKRAFAKPVIGSGSQWVLDITDSDSDQMRFEELALSHTLIVQEYEPGYHSGENCLIYFEGQFQYAINKPPLGVPEFKYIQPEKDELEMAEKVIAYFDETPLIARVDLVRRENGELVLGECEIIDPDLFITDYHALKLADIVIRRVLEKRKTC